MEKQANGKITLSQEETDFFAKIGQVGLCALITNCCCSRCRDYPVYVDAKLDNAIRDIALSIRLKHGAETSRFGMKEGDDLF